MFTHRINLIHIPIPKNVQWRFGLFYVSHPAYKKHIGHFAEAISPLLLKLRFPKEFPPMTDFYIPRFENDEFEWSKTYLKLLLNLFPKNLTPALYLSKDIKINQTICFRSAVFVFPQFIV